MGEFDQVIKQLPQCQLRGRGAWGFLCFSRDGFELAFELGRSRCICDLRVDVVSEVLYSTGIGFGILNFHGILHFTLSLTNGSQRRHLDRKRLDPSDARKTCATVEVPAFVPANVGSPSRNLSYHAY